MNEVKGASMRQAMGKQSVPPVVLCVDSELENHPALLGLGDENISSQPWLEVFHDAGLARKTLHRSESLQKVWVVSSDTIEGINLAAAIKHDNAERPVSLVSFEGSGSLLGRCQAAGVELIRNKGEFMRRYSEEKQRSLLLKQEEGSSNVPSGAEEVKDLPVEEPQWQGSLQQGCGYRSPASEAKSPSSVQVGNGTQLGDSTQRANKAREQACQKEAGCKIAASSQTQTEQKWPALQPSATESDAFVLAVISGSGGVGKSTVAVSAAVTYQRLGHKTLLLDADLQFGDMSYLLGGKQVLEITELLENPQRIGRLQPSDGLPALLAAPKSLEQSELIMGRMAELIAFLRGQFEVIVINTGAFWSEQQAQIIESADRVVFLLDQRPSSIRACSHALDLCARCGIPTQSFWFVLNFCSRKALLTSLDVSCALQGVKVEELKDGGKEVGELLSAGLPQELIAAKNPFSESLKELCRALLPDKTSPAQTPAQEAGTHKKGRLLGLRKRKVAACL